MVDRNERVWRRGRRDAWHWLHSPWAGACQVLIGFGVAAVVSLILAESASDLERALLGLAGGAGALLLFWTVVFAVQLVLAPVRQRDEARAALRGDEKAREPDEVAEVIEQLAQTSVEWVGPLDQFLRKHGRELVGGFADVTLKELVSGWQPPALQLTTVLHLDVIAELQLLRIIDDGVRREGYSGFGSWTEYHLTDLGLRVVQRLERGRDVTRPSSVER